MTTLFCSWNNFRICHENAITCTRNWLALWNVWSHPVGPSFEARSSFNARKSRCSLTDEGAATRAEAGSSRICGWGVLLLNRSVQNAASQSRYVVGKASCKEQAFSRITRDTCPVISPDAIPANYRKRDLPMRTTAKKGTTLPNLNTHNAYCSETARIHRAAHGARVAHVAHHTRVAHAARSARVAHTLHTVHSAQQRPESPHISTTSNSRRQDDGKEEEIDVLAVSERIYKRPQSATPSKMQQGLWQNREFCKCQ